MLKLTQWLTEQERWQASEFIGWRSFATPLHKCPLKLRKDLKACLKGQEIVRNAAEVAYYLRQFGLTQRKKIDCRVSGIADLEGVDSDKIAVWPGSRMEYEVELILDT